jgi:hypothetical protein
MVGVLGLAMGFGHVAPAFYRGLPDCTREIENPLLYHFGPEVGRRPALLPISADGTLSLFRVAGTTRLYPFPPHRPRGPAPDSGGPSSLAREMGVLTAKAGPVSRPGGNGNRTCLRVRDGFSTFDLGLARFPLIPRSMTLGGQLKQQFDYLFDTMRG